MAKKVTIPKITLSEVNKKHLKVLGYLVASWAIPLLLAELTKDIRLIGLVPVLNMLLVIIKQELNKEGYVEALKK